MITLREKVIVYETIMHRLHMHRAITMNQSEIIKILEAVSSWSRAHQDGNGEKSESEIKRAVEAAFNKLRDI